MVYKPCFFVCVYYSRCLKAELPADLATLRNRLTQLEWGGGKCRFKT